MRGVSLPPYRRTDVITHSLLIAESYKRLLGRPLVPEDVAVKDIAEWMWKAPFGLLAHDAGNPRLFEYGNQMALELFETDFEELAGTPSTRSADNEVEVQADRSQALAAALEKGYITGYSGWRRSFQGARFLIKDAILFNVMSPTGEVIGQAAQLNGWEKEGAETSEVQGH